VLTESLIEAFTSEDSEEKMTRLEAALARSQSIPDMVNTAMSDLVAENEVRALKTNFQALMQQARELLQQIATNNPDGAVA